MKGKITIETRGVDVKLGLLQFVAQLTYIRPIEIKMSQNFGKTNMK